MRALSQLPYNSHPQVISAAYFKLQKMKLPACLCGLVRGFHHDLSCWSCGFLPWQHTSEEEESFDSEAEEARRKREDYEEQRFKIREEEERKIEKEREQNYNKVLTTIENAEVKLNLEEERFERSDSFIGAKRKLKKKTLKTKSERFCQANRRLDRRSFTQVKYMLNVHDHYMAKSKHEFDQVFACFKYAFDEAKYMTHRFFNAQLTLDDLPWEVESFDEVLRVKARDEKIADEIRRLQLYRQQNSFSD